MQSLIGGSIVKRVQDKRIFFCLTFQYNIVKVALLAGDAHIEFVRVINSDGVCGTYVASMFFLYAAKVWLILKCRCSQMRLIKSVQPE